MESQSPLLYELRLMYKKYIHAGGDENEQTSGRNPLKFAARLAGQSKAAKFPSQLVHREKKNDKIACQTPPFYFQIYIFAPVFARQLENDWII